MWGPFQTHKAHFSQAAHKSGRHNYVLCASQLGLHRMHYTEWGDPDNRRTLICAHGLTRNGRDFDTLARYLSNKYRVVCPDFVGRGESDWLSNASLYGFSQYIADSLVLLARLDIEQADWLGTSMGGLIGMCIAAMKLNPIKKLILNDVGPEISRQSLLRIGEYLGKTWHWPDISSAEKSMREHYAPFGTLSDNQWKTLTSHSVRPAPDGGFQPHYDPGLAKPFLHATELQDSNLWQQYDTITCPVLTIRGADSDLLTPAVLQKMTQRLSLIHISEPTRPY